MEVEEYEYHEPEGQAYMAEERGVTSGSVQSMMMMMMMMKSVGLKIMKANGLTTVS